MHVLALVLLLIASPERGPLVPPPGLPAPKAVPAPPLERFEGTIRFGDLTVAVMSTTDVTLDGSPRAYGDVPDEGTELVEIAVDVRRRVATKLAYVTKRDI